MLQEVTAGQRSAIEAHHLLEQRHLLNWGYSAAEIAEAPAQVLTRAEHREISRRLLSELPTGIRYTREQVLRAYSIVYSEYPKYLEAIAHYF